MRLSVECGGRLLGCCYVVVWDILGGCQGADM